jgi:asparagine synthase (glutamine-hydrolysing)
MINLSLNKGFNWYHSNNIHVKGVFFDNTEKLYNKTSMPSYFKKAASFENFTELLKNCNGIFSVIVEYDDEIWAAVDRNISFPVFYSTENSQIKISDDANYLLNTLQHAKTDTFQKSIFRSFGHTFNNKTLINNIYQIRCGEAIKIKNNNIIETQYYHTFSVDKFINKQIKELLNTGYNKFENAIKRLIQSLNGKTAVVPLSGGYDSRLIAVGLKKHGYENVICFTYGNSKNNPDLPTSKRVAEKLGYKWFFIEYNNREFADFNNTNEFEDYLYFVGHLTSMPFLQEYFAVRHLKKNKLIPDNAVFIPGHSGDLIGGSQFIKVFDENLTIDSIAKIFVKKKSIYKKLSKQNKKQLEKYINNEITNNNSAPTIFEEIDIREKISKFIFNSSMVYDFFDYEKRFPFWDTELLNFFLWLPFKYREMKKLYNSIIIENYFKPYGLYFEEELEPTKKQIVIQKFKNKIKLLLPTLLKLKLLKKPDWKNYYEITAILSEDMKQKKYNFKFYGLSLNEILLEYYLFNLKKS